ncbi:hypothetical protein RvY_03981-2 [Ramazzottius varieornatus]|uniref:Uncharacterized protein n=1 Tax=Ramazzottius varieornatus TaxID=947166 RepID=A0A1D1UQR1_RAMVA|nr:hypothetical protein RvY_03981-2 [Ramazzottius varieornatus]
MSIVITRGIGFPASCSTAAFRSRHNSIVLSQAACRSQDGTFHNLDLPDLPVGQLESDRPGSAVRILFLSAARRVQRHLRTSRRRLPQHRCHRWFGRRRPLQSCGPSPRTERLWCCAGGQSQHGFVQLWPTQSCPGSHKDLRPNQRNILGRCIWADRHRLASAVSGHRPRCSRHPELFRLPA